LNPRFCFLQFLLQFLHCQSVESTTQENSTLVTQFAQMAECGGAKNVSPLQSDE